MGDRDVKFFDNKLLFEDQALTLFNFQYNHNLIYKSYTDALGILPGKVDRIDKIPFLPIRFFKEFSVKTTDFEPEKIFESSGTTGVKTSRHLIRSIELYEKSFYNCFRQFYGNPENWCIIGLLPSFPERSSSSLVYMVDKLIKKSGNAQSGFFLSDFEKLSAALALQEKQKQQTLFIGVTHALLEFAQNYPQPLNYTTVMETGGMKGRRKEMIRNEVHEMLCSAFDCMTIHSEYGMTELLSQSYSGGNGLFKSPEWMKVFVRDEEDPLTIQKSGRGALNIIDLANVYSCAFIATDDIGIVHTDCTFEVAGRIDKSDKRGCSLLIP